MALYHLPQYYDTYLRKSAEWGQFYSKAQSLNKPGRHILETAIPHISKLKPILIQMRRVKNMLIPIPNCEQIEVFPVSNLLFKDSGR